MGPDTLKAEDIEYIADMLSAISWAKVEMRLSSKTPTAELDEALGAAEAALRRAAAEVAMKAQD